MRIITTFALAVAILCFVVLPAEAANRTADLFKPFSPSGPAWSIVQLLVIAVGGTAAGMFASALGKGQIANWIKLLTTLACIGTVVIEISKAVTSVFKLMGY